MSREGKRISELGTKMHDRKHQIDERIKRIDLTVPSGAPLDLFYRKLSSQMFQSQVELLGEAGDLLAGKLHNKWRDENFKNEDGTYRPRVKSLVQRGEAQKWVNQDQVTAEDILLFEQDIANTDYEDLHPHWQNDNKQAADFVVGLLVQHGREIDLQDEGELTWSGNAVHNAWLSRAGWIEPGLEVPFADLSREQQAKDLQQVELANELFFAE